MTVTLGVATGFEKWRWGRDKKNNNVGVNWIFAICLLTRRDLAGVAWIRCDGGAV